MINWLKELILAFKSRHDCENCKALIKELEFNRFEREKLISRIIELTSNKDVIVKIDNEIDKDETDPNENRLKFATPRARGAKASHDSFNRIKALEQEFISESNEQATL